MNKPLHPFHARSGLAPLANMERTYVCRKCGTNFRLSDGGQRVGPSQSAFGLCKAHMKQPVSTAKVDAEHAAT